MSLGSDIRSVTPQCRIVVFPWVNEVPFESLSYEELSFSSPIDVSRELVSCNFSKTKDSPAGSFSFSLANTRDWKDVIKPGQWCLIYMSNDGDLNLPQGGDGIQIARPDLSELSNLKSKVRCIGYIDRVAVKGTQDEGVMDATFSITGRDFGVVYEETTIWHNYFLFDTGIIDAAVASLKARDNFTSTVDELLETIHQLFYSPAHFPSLATRDQRDPTSLTQIGNQWLLPRELLQALELELDPSLPQDPFYGHLADILNFSPSKMTYPIENVMSTLTGNAWEKLQTHCIQQFHELFPETDSDGHPQLTYRPIPWKLKDAGYPSVSDSIQAYLDLAEDAVSLAKINIMDFDLGEDNHARYNHYAVTVQSTDYKESDNITDLQFPSDAGRTFPYAQTSSIARHGFRPMHVDINAMVQLGVNNDGRADQKGLVQFNEVLFDYWSNAVFFESGSVNIIGSNEVKVGKMAAFQEDCPYNANKIFYIEGYEDDFTIDEKGVGSWTQTLTLTRGADIEVVNALIENSDEVNGTKFSKRARAFNESGSYTGKK